MQTFTEENWSNMTAALAKPGLDIISKMTSSRAHLLHMAVGVSGEVAEWLDCVCSVELDKDNLLEESGDILFYIQGIVSELRSDPNWGSCRMATDIDCGAEEEEVVVAAGHLLDTIKKTVIYNRDLDCGRVHSLVLYILDGIEWQLRRYDLSLIDAKEHNWNKLGHRYEGHNYSDKAAQDRADKA